MDSWSLVVMVGAVVAVAAGVRSTWSPCGLSMLSSITPFGERSRGHRYGVTASWFVVGSALGGATLGVLAAGLAAGVRASGLVSGHPVVLLLLAGAAALLAAAVDAGLLGDVMPLWRRQVNDGWLARYRSWVYGIGFGWQIGAGVTTYIMTAAVLLTVVLAALLGVPWVAWGLSVGFGLVRGVAVLLTARASTPARLRTLHAGMDRLGPPVRWATIAVQGVGGVVLGAAAIGAWVVPALAVGAAAATAVPRVRRSGLARAAAGDRGA